MYLQITTRCNMACEHCCNDCGYINECFPPNVVPVLVEALEDAKDYIVARMPDTLGKDDHLEIIRQALANTKGK